MATTIPNKLTRTGDNELKTWTDGCRLTSGDKFGRPAIYNATTKTYKQNIDIEDSASYCMQSYTITSGPLAGCKAIILVPAGSFRFLDLPREIRNIIYSLLVTRHRSRKLVTYGRAGDARRRAVRPTFKDRSKIAKNGWDAETKKFNLSPSDSMSLLLVNRQMMEEVAKVLYGTNTFAFDNTETLKLFLKTCADALRYIRSVELDFYTFSATPRDRMHLELKGSQQVLWQATSLRQVQIDHAIMCQIDMDANTVVEIFMPLLKKLQNFKAIQGIGMKVEEVLHFQQCLCGSCWRRKLSTMKRARYSTTTLARYLNGPGKCSSRCIDVQNTLPQQVKKMVAERLPVKT